MTTEMIKEVLERREQLTVNSNKDINNTVNSYTVSSKEKDSVDQLLSQFVYEPEAAAKELSTKLDDERSYRYYLLLAKNNPIDKLFEALSFVIEAENQGRIRTKKPPYFIAILKNWGLKTNFRR
ncbi:hypothetical protein M1116_01890 [Patescibacteria group bacterium]|nr:hypothetical protein [Patescibacteria group bacterium]